MIKEIFEADYCGYKQLTAKVLNTVFGEIDTEKFESWDSQLTDSDKGIIKNVCVFGSIELTDTNDLIFIDVTLQPKVQISKSKVQIQQFIRKTMAKLTAAIIVFHYPDNTGEWRMSFVYKDDKADGNTTAKRYTYLFGKNQHCRTADERFTWLASKEKSTKNIIEAFNVETLTKQFYKDLFSWYEWTLSETDGFAVTFPNDTSTESDDRKIDEHVIRLITRLMFVWFIKQKDLIPPAIFNLEELDKTLKDFDPQSKTSGNYYNAILQNLFFATLNKAIDERAFANDGSHEERKEHYGIKTLFRNPKGGSWFKKTDEEIIKLFSQVPFLNGGLFECLDKEIDSKGKIMYFDGFSREAGKQQRAFIPNCLFFDEQKGLIPLLERYNFTIEENSPTDVEVALDPELLGKVFENLLGAYNPETKETARKQSGSFYTPREIVNYMVDESLIAYLTTKCPTIEEPKLRALFSLDHETKSDFDTQTCITLTKELKAAKILDPACGSGAFPMGVLNRMVDLLQKLDDEEAKDAYKQKLHLIENCIYGIDIQTIAVQISKLRFFISLICEQPKIENKAENYGIIPLPNLETKFVAANTLIGLENDITGKLDLGFTEVREKKKVLWNLRSKHFSARNATEKHELRKQDAKLRNEIQKLLVEISSKPDLQKIASLELEITALEKEKFLFKGVNMVSLVQPTAVQTAMFVDENAPVQQTLTYDKNKEERKRLEKQIKEKQKELQAEQNKTKQAGFEAEAVMLAHWNPYDQNTSATFFDAEWMFGFNNGFDVVIGNPPYGAELTDNEIKYYKSTYDIKTSETAILFVEKGIKLLKNNGFESYIIPKSFTFASNYSDIREYVTESLSFLVDCGKAFENVKLEACIFGLLKNQKTLTYRSIKFKNDCSFENICLIDKSLKTKYGFFPNGLLKVEIDLGNKIFSKSILLGAISQNSRGEFLQNKMQSVGKFCIIGGKEINKYGIKGEKGYINDNSQITYKAKIHENSILAQNIVAHLTQPYDHLKIIACIPDQINCLLVDTINQLTIISSDFSQQYIWSLLNSKLTNWYCYLFILAKAIRTIHFDNVFTSRIPIFVHSLESQQPLINLVDQILTTKKADPKSDTTNLERKIDEMVYKLYDLTYAEVLVIDKDFWLSEAEYAAVTIG